MTIRVRGTISMWALAAAMIAAPALGQVTAPVARPPLPLPSTQPMPTLPVAQPPIAPVPAPLPPAMWDPASVAQLIAALHRRPEHQLREIAQPGLRTQMVQVRVDRMR